MQKYHIDVSNEAKKHLKYWKSSGNKASRNRIDQIFQELKISPRSGIGNPEYLKYKKCWARRINQKDRLTYTIKDDVVTVVVLSAKGHYDDK